MVAEAYNYNTKTSDSDTVTLSSGGLDVAASHTAYLSNAQSGYIGGTISDILKVQTMSASNVTLVQNYFKQKYTTDVLEEDYGIPNQLILCSNYLQRHSGDNYQIDRKETDALCVAEYSRTITTDKIPFYVMNLQDRRRPFDKELPREIDLYFLHGTRKVECTFNVQLDFTVE